MDFSPTALYRRLNDDLVAHFSGSLSGDSTLNEWLNRPEASVKEFAALHLLESLLKKYQDGKSESIRSQRAIAKFREVNAACASYRFDPESLSLAGRECHDRVKQILANVVEDHEGPRFTWQDVYAESKFGPGSSYGTDGTSEYEKLSGTIGCTKEELYLQWVEDRGLYSLEAKTDLVRRFARGKVRIRDESSLSCVSKNAEVDRTICSEPSINTFYQLGTGGVLTKLLKRFMKIDLVIQQQVNRMLARVGSVTGRYATIDLTSASDSISRTIVIELFPRWFSGFLNDLRCSTTRLPNGSKVELHMISSMGNGFTFPLQTLMFSAIVRAAYHICGVEYRGADAKHPTMGVNGDDIIVDMRAYNLVIEMLSAYGFSVNSTKTFSTGPFRESCGGDYYVGHYVRGVYAKTLSSSQDFVSLINRLVVWSARWDISLKATIGYLANGRVNKAPLVPRWDSDTSGIKVPTDLFLKAQAKRKITVKMCRETGSVLYRRWAARPSVVHIVAPPEPEFIGPSAPLEVRYNEAALIACAISGTIRNRSFAKRSIVVNYESRVAVAPSWEQWQCTQWRDLSIPAIGQQRWSSAALENLTEIL